MKIGSISRSKRAKVIRLTKPSENTGFEKIIKKININYDNSARDFDGRSHRPKVRSDVSEFEY
jgi:hypothetical protein